MNILVFNCGSSSLKYRLLAMPAETELAGGEAQRISPKTAVPSRIVHRCAGREQIITRPLADHAAAFAAVMELLGSQPRLFPAVLAHRVVHGGDRFTGPTLLDGPAFHDLEQLSDLAPLHNPPALALIRACREHYPSLPQVAVFDTAFHATIPEHARQYGLPRRLTRELGLRKFGFHGTSHRYVMREAAHFLGIPVARFSAVSAHLGSGGASLCAIVDGCSVDNTMGYSSLPGLVMSTRGGDLDPAVPLNLMAGNVTGVADLEAALYRTSGVLGLSGTSSDIRDLLAGPGTAAGQEPADARTTETYLWRLRTYLGAYLLTAGNPAAVIFTDTIGEMVPAVRWSVCAGLEQLGVGIDPHLNELPGPLPRDIATAESPVRILVMATNEELAIARETYELLHYPSAMPVAEEA